jgi:hypothetical protein
VDPNVPALEVPCSDTAGDPVIEEIMQELGLAEPLCSASNKSGCTLMDSCATCRQPLPLCFCEYGHCSVLEYRERRWRDIFGEPKSTENYAALCEHLACGLPTPTEGPMMHEHEALSKGGESQPACSYVYHRTYIIARRKRGPMIIVLSIAKDV